jgi:hypothetical protein
VLPADHRLPYNMEDVVFPGDWPVPRNNSAR